MIKKIPALNKTLSVQKWKALQQNLASFWLGRFWTSGVAVLSTEDKLSWIVQVETVPKGFKVIRSVNGSNFYCSSCGRPAEP